MMSPTYYEVHCAHFNAELEAARKANDVQGMRRALAELTDLRRAMYGQHLLIVVAR